MSRLENALRELTDALSDVAERERLSLPKQIDLRLELGGTDSKGWKKRTQRCLEGFSESALETNLTAAFPTGHVWCFQCARIDCVHSKPDDERAVFSGYHATGKPKWAGFLDVCLQQKKRDVGRLFGQRRSVVALAHGGQELNAAMLFEFSTTAKGFEVMGQAVVGLVSPTLARKNVQGEGIVLTVQVVRMRETQPHLQLRFLGIEERDIIIAAAENSPRSPAEQLRRTLEKVRRRLASIERRAYRGDTLIDPPYLVDAVGAVVNRIRGDLNRIFNSRDDRTAHGRKRHQGGQRPTTSAKDDARSVSSERLLMDTRRKTLVVVGPRSRAHIFTVEGLHVTSLRLEPGELERKMSRTRWRRTSSTEFEQFRRVMENTDADTGDGR